MGFRAKYSLLQFGLILQKQKIDGIDVAVCNYYGKKNKWKKEEWNHTLAISLQAL